MNPVNGWDMYVFRGGRKLVQGESLLRDLRAELQRCEAAGCGRIASVDALIRAGELECVLADEASGRFFTAMQTVQRATEQLALSLVTGEPFAYELIEQELASLHVPETARISAAEGFAFYALHPLDYVELLRSEPAIAEHPGEPFVIIGLRSIGTTLSAVVWAELHRRGMDVKRFTVRPRGEPYSRVTKFSHEQIEIVQGHERARFLIVDEGPGISGSSFLSVADSLVEMGVSREQITMLCSRWADPDSLTAPDGARRWRSYRSFVVHPTKQLPQDAVHFLSGGIWRGRMYASEAEWPGAWMQMEKLKFLDAHEQRLFKYVGLGRYGAQTIARGTAMRETGFTPDACALGDGFVEMPWFGDARPLSLGDLNEEMIRNIARYCAQRARFCATADQPEKALGEMACKNIQVEFGCNVVPELPVERPVIADARMMPHEWIRLTDGRVLKLDCASHGDDHLFPGPTDIAWDLAGAIIEWRMDESAQEMLLREYRRLSGDSADSRLAGYLVAYNSFRMGWAAMASQAHAGSDEGPRLLREFAVYRASMADLLEQPIARGDEMAVCEEAA